MKALFTFFAALVFFCAKAQTVFYGKVSDSLTKEPLEGATIYNQNTGAHSHSDALGNFQLKSSAKGDTIKVYYIGYENTTYIFDGSASIEIKLVPANFELNQVTITPDISALTSVANINLKLSPLNSSQEVLRKVPGLFIAQHAGGGKAEQIFLRGFDIDHGTDVQITADGLPVNMVSHAHGQGYADLHFVIPETIKNIDFGKGPYYAEKGDFATAGYVDFQTLDRIEKSSVKLEAGDFNTLRLVGLVDLVNDAEKTDAYIATEYYITDGPFESPQDFNRLNIFGKYTTHVNQNFITVQASALQSKWNASGQVPDRAVQSGIISRFGSIDDTEGGETSRNNLTVKYKSVIDENSFLESNVFYSNYAFELYSNFTFFLNDPVNGDQIRQKENRNIYGFNTSYNAAHQLVTGELNIEAGVGFRYDDINNIELSHTKQRRETLSTSKLDDIDQLNGFLYGNAEWTLGKWMINPGLRIDYLKFDVVNKLAPTYVAQSEAKAFIGPKLNIIYSPNEKWQWYVKSGRGFHSNDARVVVAEKGKNILPAAYGADLGTIYKPFTRLYINAALWYLYLEQEFVYVGDEGVVEPSGKTTRKGVDFGLTYQLNKWLFADVNVNLAQPISIEDPEGANNIPLAPRVTSVGGLSFNYSGISGSMRYRYMADRPANEDNTVVAQGYFVSDLVLNYDRNHWGIGITVENIFDTEWREAQFDTESRLMGETAPVSEIHYTPGTPRFIRGRISFKF
ncbi:MAG: TonB-dependent receptor [Cyclobacteriaceae bacterium]|nr:TonB-dependent receptor [Cyclobacteriaceae bacterium]